MALVRLSILLAFVCVALSACVESQPITSAPLSKPTVYEWIGPGPSPSSQRLIDDTYTCARSAEQIHSRRAKSTSEAWQTHVNLCMRTKGWGQNAID
jgi:hypothetical protein